MTLARYGHRQRVLLRLLGQQCPKYENRIDFFSLAARVMRQIRVDHLRREAADKRGGWRDSNLACFHRRRRTKKRQHRVTA